jgi:hypothetical protein
MRANPLDLGSPSRWGDLGVAGARSLRDRCSGSCGLPHWGYVIRGVVRVEYPDHDEVISAGDAYYVAPAHVAIHLGDAELVDFGPAVTPPPPDRTDPART